MSGSDAGPTKETGGDHQARRASAYPLSVDDFVAPEGVVAWLGEVPDHIAVASALPGVETDVVLGVRPVPFQQPPAPPESVAAWVTEPFDDPTSPPEVRTAIAAEVTDTTGDRPPPPIVLDAHPDIRDEIDLWLPFWHLWALAERHDGPARALHARLRAAHESTTADNGLELVLAFGLLSWVADQGRTIRRHLVTAPVTTEVDVVSGEVRVVANGRLGVELDMVDPQEIQDAVVPAEVTAWTNEYAGAVTDRERIEENVRRLAVALRRDLTYRPTDERPEPTDVPVVTWAPALLLRRPDVVIDLRDDPVREPTGPPGGAPRPSGFTYFDEVPSTGPTPDHVVSDDDVDAAPVAGYFVDDQPSAVEERLDDVADAASAPNFPPVEEPWAPAEPMADPAHDDVVDRMHDTAKETRDAATTEVATHQTLEARQESLLDALASLRRERTLIRQDLANARAAEAPAHLLPYAGSRARIAERLAAEAVDHAWIAAARVIPGSSAPVADSHMRHWVALRSDPKTLADQHLATGELLAIHRMPTVRAFQSVIDDEERAHQKADTYGHSTTAMAEAVGGLSETAAVSMRGLVVEISAALGSVDIANHRWAGDALRDIRAGESEAWLHRRAAVTALVTQAEELLAAIDTNTSVKCAGPMADHISQAVTLREWLAGGNEVKVTDEGRPRHRLRVPRVVADSAGLLERVRVNGTPPSSIADLDAFLAWARAGTVVEQLEDQWPSPVNLDGTDGVRVRLDRHRVALAELDRLLMVRDKLTSLDAQFGAHGVEGVSFDDPSSVALFLEELDRAAAHQRAAAATELVLRGERRVQPFLELPTPPDWAQAFSRAVRTRDALAYQQVRDRVQYLNGLRENLQWCEGIEGRLRPALGSILDTVSEPNLRDEWARRADSFGAAWRWVGAKAWLEEGEVLIRRVAEELRVVDGRIDQTIDRLWALIHHERDENAQWSERVDELAAQLRAAQDELDRLRTENAVLRQLGDMVPERPDDLDRD